MSDLIFQLPPSMEPFRERLLQTKAPFVRARAGKSGSLQLWQSKVGGNPYWPKGADWPSNSSGEELFFLAQINFAEVPTLAPFPNKGIVQFFIADDGHYGMDEDEAELQNGFRVIWHPEPINDNNLLQSRAPLRPYDDLPHHPDESFPLKFELAEETASLPDYRFWEIFGQDFFQQFGKAEWDVQNEFAKKCKAEGHKIGGYAYFTQDDPRTAADPMLLLFQLDCDEDMDLMWGDMGVGHFFIREKDLLARDFSRVLYDWDCL